MKQVLVIEDDRDLSNLFAMILKMGGFEVDIVSDGREAVRRLDEPLPDAITLDLHLPGVSGSDIFAMLEQRKEVHRVLVCSADVQEVQNYVQRGAEAVTKPVAMDDLIRRVTAIAEHSLVAELS